MGNRLIAIKDALKIKSGNFIRKKDLNDKYEYPVYGGNGQMGFTTSYNLENENLIIGRVGAKCGNVRLIYGKVWISDNAFYISELKEDYDLSFLAVILEYLDLGKTANQAAQPVISFKSIKNLKIPLPPLPEQRRIVAKLDGLFEKIDRAITLVEENIAHTQALMGSVLDEEFGRLDCNYVVLKDLVNKVENCSPKKDFPNEDFNYVDISSINRNTLSIENPKVLTGKDAPSRAKKVLAANDIVFATTRPNLKNIAVVKPKESEYVRFIASTGFCVLRSKEDLNHEYLFFFLQSDMVQDHIADFIRGAQYPAISDKNLLSIEIPLPELIIQKQIAKRIKNLRSALSKLGNQLTEQLASLKSLKSSLLDKAFKGEL